MTKIISINAQLLSEIQWLEYGLERMVKLENDKEPITTQDIYLEDKPKQDIIQALNIAITFFFDFDNECLTIERLKTKEEVQFSITENNNLITNSILRLKKRLLNEEYKEQILAYLNHHKNYPVLDLITND